MSICKCTTEKGTQCSFKAKYGPYCWHHADIKTGIATLSKGCKTPWESPKYVQPQKVQPNYVQPQKVQQDKAIALPSRISYIYDETDSTFIVTYLNTLDQYYYIYIVKGR